MGSKNCCCPKKESEADSDPSPPPYSDNSGSTNNVENSGNKYISDNEVHFSFKCSNSTK